MLKILLFLSVLLLFQKTIYAQEIKSISQKEIYFNEDGYDYADSITHLELLPLKITKEVDLLLKRWTGEFYDSIKFEKAQIVDLKKYESTKFLDSTLVDYHDFHLIIPKYFLIYKLKSIDVNIHSIYIKIELDEYGQILNFEWPNLLVTKSQFISLDEINTKYSKIKKKDSKEGFKTSIEFEFDKGLKKFNWVIHSFKHSGMCAQINNIVIKATNKK